MSDSTKANLPIEKLGPAGILGELVVVPQYPQGTVTDEQRLHDHTKRKFKLQAMLGKHSAREEEITLAFNKNEGGSFVLANSEALVSKLYSPSGEMFLHHNAERELSLVEFECMAHGLAEAKQIFLHDLTPFLDHLSYVANIPLHVIRVGITDSVHHIQSVEYIGPHGRVELNPHASSMREELIPIYALYREAKNNPSSFYKFLCYYKMLEGVYSWLRPELFKRAKERGVRIRSRKELVPELEDLGDRHGRLVGRPIKEVFDRRLRSEFRDRAAHYLLNEGEPLNVSNFQIHAEFSGELVLMEACVRVVVSTHEAYLNEFEENVV